MLLPVSLIILGIIYLVLNILFNYLLIALQPQGAWFKPVVSLVVILLVLVCWFEMPSVHVG